MQTKTKAERDAFAAGARKAEHDRDMRAMERIAKSLERIVEMMETTHEPNPYKRATGRY